MTRKLATALLAASALTMIPTAALAQDQAAQLTPEEVAQMRAEMAAMQARLAAMEAQVEAANATAAAAAEAAQEGGSGLEVEWKGAPKLKGEGGWSFKPRGRLQYDVGIVEAPNAIVDPGLGTTTEVRRARLGVEGDIPGGFGYKFELDFSDGVEATDAMLTYKSGGFKAAVGQQNNFQSLEELTSSLSISFMERAAFTDAFGFERRVGASGEYSAGPVLVQGGVFTDNISDLDDENNSYGFDGRIVAMPKLGSTQLHFGGSIHYRDIQGAGNTVRYRQRPFVHTTDTRFLNTGNFTATSETGYGLEAAAISGPFHVAGEAFWQHVSRPGALADPTFFGGYAEAGFFLTGGDKRGYKGGKFDRIKPANPVGEGGLGAVQVNLRYDYLDLNDAGIIGGTQNGYGISLIWTPTDYTRFMMNYGRMEYDNAAILNGLSPNYGVDVFGMRAQVDF